MHDLGPATASAARVVALVTDDALERPTPCSAWTVGDLVEHLAGLAWHFAGVARGRPPTSPPPASDRPDGWRDLLVQELVDLAEAWRTPGAWDGEDEAGGVRMPRAALGIVALDEVVLHGWDLAAALSVPWSVPDADVAACLPFVEQVAGMPGGPFAIPQPGAGESSGLVRLLRLSGRDPAAGPPELGPAPEGAGAAGSAGAARAVRPEGTDGTTE